jgi:two-component system OmpR family sensor kinase
MLLLLVVGIAVTDVATRLTLRTFLYGRLDEQADAAQSRAYTYIETVYHRAVIAGDRNVVSDPGGWLGQLASPVVENPSGPSSAPEETLPPAPAAGTTPRVARLNPAVLVARDSPDVYIEVLDTHGHVLFSDPSGSTANPDPEPVLPPRLPVRRAPPTYRFGTSHGVYVPEQPAFTVGAVGQHGPYYRGQALAVPGGLLVTAIPLAPTVETLRSLTKVEAVVSALVVVALVLLVLWTVRVGLRPLGEMTDTARAIADGDMRRRIRRTDERTEVGLLGSALNRMLSQIEAAFGERHASEARLRRFVADASHELRTPLTSIRGYAELLRKGALADDEARRRAAQRIEREAARMGVLVDDLLLLARLDQGRPLEAERVDLAKVVGEAVEAARAADPGHPLDVTLAPGAEVEGDGLRLRQVVDNLLANASVHTPPGTPVHVLVEREGSQVTLVVVDEGPGLAEGQAERVFDRFYRAGDARSRPGSGLGLSIVAALAEAHGGRAEAESSPGHGARFRVVLPLAPSGASAASRAAGPGPEAGPDAGPDAGPGPGSPADGGTEADERTTGEPARR